MGSAPKIGRNGALRSLGEGPGLRFCVPLLCFRYFLGVGRAFLLGTRVVYRTARFPTKLPGVTLPHVFAAAQAGIDDRRKIHGMEPAAVRQAGGFFTLPGTFRITCTQTRHFKRVKIAKASTG